jgi:hypothetical protein
MSEYSDETGQQEFEEQSLLQRMHQIGSDVLAAFSKGFHENQRKGVALLAVGSAALGGSLGTEMVDLGGANNAAAIGVEKAGCLPFVHDTVNISYVDGTVLPLAKEVINVYRHTRRSDLTVKKNTVEMSGNSYGRVTQINGNLPAKLANGEPGSYNYTVDFSGPITPKDMVAITVEPLKSGANLSTSKPLYDFELIKTRGNIYDPNVGLQWKMMRVYSDTSNLDAGAVVESRIENGYEIPGTYSMTAPILRASIRQVNGILEGAAKHESIKIPKDLAKSENIVKVCS